MNLKAAVSTTGLTVQAVSHTFGEETVLSSFSCKFEKGALIAILGPSGCGKTTFLKIVAGLISPTSGSVFLDGISPADARRRGQIGFAFQSPVLLPWRTTLENVLLPTELLGSGESNHYESAANTLLSEVGLEGDSTKLPRELSGGMRQRVSLARALITQPTYLFLDEPFGALDGLTRDRLNEKVRDVWQSNQGNRLTIMFVTHSIEEAVFLADEIVIFTPRPAKIHAQLPIELGAVRNYNTRSDRRFMDYVIEVRHLTKGMS